jgi:hypothetical protein
MFSHKGCENRLPSSTGRAEVTGELHFMGKSGPPRPGFYAEAEMPRRTHDETEEGTDGRRRGEREDGKIAQFERLKKRLTK